MIALLLVACLDLAVTEDLTAPDLDDFVVDVQPHFATSCANPGCHGNSARPFSVHAVGLHRLDPSATWLDTPLTDEELWLDYQSARLFLLGAAVPSDSPLIRKPLAVEAGGVAHQGGTYYASLDHPDARVVAAWIASGWAEAP